MTSFFDQATRWPVRPWMDPKENRLTAALGSVLQAVPPLRMKLLEEWLPNVPPPARSEVTVQRPVPSGTIDLQIDSSSALVWVEVKYHAPLSGPDQLQKYLRDLLAVPGRREKRLVLLIPASRAGEDLGAQVVWNPVDSAVTGSRPRHAMGYTWQDIHRALPAFDRGPNEQIHRWLTSGLRAFLKENGLAEQPLTKKLVDALDARAELDETLELLLKRAASDVTAVWGPTDRKRVRWERDEYEHHIRGRGRNWRRESRLVWALDASSPGNASFYAGLRCEDGGPLTKAANDDWIRGMDTANENNFHLDSEGTQHWLVTSREISWLLKHKDATDQAAALAAWVISAFERITRDSPPA